MNRVRTMEALDLAISTSDRPRAVPSLPLVTGGVDPLGLRQLNFELMDKCIPGLNNAAWRLRPYALMAWSWWRASNLAKRAGLQSLPVALGRRYVDRIEVLFQTGHLAAGDYGSLPGSEGIQGRVIANGGYDFSSPDWDDWHDRRQGQGGLMSAVSYGPSVKEGLGMAYLRADGGAFAPVAEVMPAVLSLDARLAPLMDHPAFAELECGLVSSVDMIGWYSLWSMSKLTPEEINVGATALMGSGGSAPRGATVSLVMGILAASGEPLTAGDIRTVASSAAAEMAADPVARRWRGLVARQLQRLSLEGLLNWVLGQASGPPVGLDALASSLLVALGASPGDRFGDWLDAPCVSDAGVDAIARPAELIYEIGRMVQADDPGPCALGLRTSVAICRAMGSPTDLFDGASDRLPLGRLAARLADASALPMRDACELIVSELLIGQHVFWAVGRSGDDTQRLRIVLDEGGWVGLQSAGRANPTPDRLETLLELSVDCGLLERAGNGKFQLLG